MTTTLIRKKLHDFIADADDKKIKGMYLLLESDISKKEEFKLSKEQADLLDIERKKHIENKSKSLSWEETKQTIRSKKK